MEEYKRTQENAFEVNCAIQGFQQTGLIFQPYYYRTGAGAEIDLIIESAKGILPIEISKRFTALDKLTIQKFANPLPDQAVMITYPSPKTESP